MVKASLVFPTELQKLQPGFRGSQWDNNGMPVPTEHTEQKTLFEWWNTRAPLELRPLLFAIPNGGRRNARTGRMLRDEGVRRGVPDIFLACPRPPFAGLWIELKRRKGGRVQKEQLEMLLLLQSNGYVAQVCHGWEDARGCICDYLRWT